MPFFVSWVYNCGRTAAGLMKYFLISLRISVVYSIADSLVRDVMNLLIVSLLLITVRLMDICHGKKKKKLYPF